MVDYGNLYIGQDKVTIDLFNNHLHLLQHKMYYKNVTTRWSSNKPRMLFHEQMNMSKRKYYKYIPSMSNGFF